MTRRALISLLLGVASTASAAPLARISVGAIDFGNVAPGASREQQFKVFSSGGDALVVRALGVTGTSFSLSRPATLPQTIPPGGSLEVVAKFLPTADGAAMGSVAVSANATSVLAPVALGGVGVTGATTVPRLTIADVQVSPGLQGVFPISLANAPGIQVAAIQFDLLQEPGAISLASVAIGAAANLAGRTLTSSALAGGRRVLITGPAEGSIGDGVVAQARFLALGGSGPSGRIGLTATRFGTNTNAIVGAAGNVFGSATIAGGGTPVLLNSPGALDFGAARLGQTVARTVSLQNTGTGTLNVSRGAIASGGTVYSLSGGAFSLELAPGAFSSPIVRFTPQTEGAFLGALTIASDSQNGASTRQVPLIGLGVGAGAAAVLATPGSAAFFSETNDLDAAATGIQAAIVYSNLGAFEGQSLSVQYATSDGAVSITRTAPVVNGQLEVRISLPASKPDGQLFLRSEAGVLLQSNAFSGGSPPETGAAGPKGVKCSLGGAGGSAGDAVFWLAALAAPGLMLRRFRRK